MNSAGLMPSILIDFFSLRINRCISHKQIVIFFCNPLTTITIGNISNHFSINTFNWTNNSPRPFFFIIGILNIVYKSLCNLI